MNNTTRLRDLFEQALGLPVTARTDFLATHCPDPALRTEIERMLAADADADAALPSGDAMAAAAVIGETDAATVLPPGAQVGMLQQQLRTRLVRAEALLGLHRNTEALHELAIIEPEYAKRFPRGSQRFAMTAQKARALARVGRMRESAAAARAALALHDQARRADPALLKQLHHLANDATRKPQR